MTVLQKDIWVFSYGSLMWDPGFEYREVCCARLDGYHRDLCILSFVFRGTPQVPGLVLGLQPGGHCVGRAFRIAGEDRDQVMAYLDAREMISDTYQPIWLEVELEDARRVEAYTFLAVPGHEQYGGHLSAEEKLALIRQGQGERGTSLQYLDNTCRHLRTLGIEDLLLEGFWQRANDQNG